MAMTPEGRVKAKCKEYLQSIGAWFYMPVSNGMGRHGIPDIICCIDGRFVGVECKAPGKKSTVSALQEREIAGIKAANGVAVVVDDVSQLMEVLENGKQG